MIPYTRKTLPNGLTVVVNRDRASKLAAVNILYRVGARNENPARTGFAHLFEHLMFRGTRAVENFDLPVQMASGDNNAFTNNDYTDFYITLPKDNLETALWLESDRMEGLDITPAKLEAEKKVVIEEFRQRYLNQPYGDQTMLLRALAYKVHPYRWAAIGLATDHIAGATLADVESFYRAHYRPSNAILSISADMEEERMLELAEKWFAPLADHPSATAAIPQEPMQTQARRQEVERDVPASTVTVAYHMCARTKPDFYTADLVSDLLSGGDSGRLYTHLVKERNLLSSVNAYITGDVDPGLFVFTGQLLPGVTPEAAEAPPAFPAPETTHTAFVEYPGAVQSSLRIGRLLFPRTHPDFLGMQVVATALGGYFGSRLMQNLREEHGYTYGVVSAMVNFEREGYFAIAAQVGADVTQEALREIYAEIERLGAEPMPEAELELVKNMMTGEMMRILDGPFGIADVTIENILCGCDNTVIGSNIRRIREMTPAGVQQLARKYLRREDLVTVVAGAEKPAGM